MPSYGIDVRIIVTGDNPRIAAERFYKEVHEPIQKKAEFCTVSRITAPAELRALIK